MRRPQQADRVQLNIVTRPPAEDCAVAVDHHHLREPAALFDPMAEVVVDFKGVRLEGTFVATQQTVLQLLQRRPCSADDIARGLSLHRNEAAKHIQELLAQKLVERVSSAQGTFLRALQERMVPSNHRRNEHAGEKGPR